MKDVRFNEKKNISLKVKRGFNFDDVSDKIKKGDLVGIIANPNKKKYPKQRIF